MAELSERKRDLLRRVVEEYVATGEPVGSKTLVQRSGLRVSASTVRHELAELESLGIRPADVWGCVRSPSDSSSASSCRTVLAETRSPERWTSVFEPTGSPVATYSSTTRRSRSRLRSLSSAICRNLPFGHQQLGRDAAAEEAPPPRQLERVPPGRDQPVPLEPGQGVAVDRVVQAGEPQGLVEAEPEHDPLPSRRLRLELLDLPLWPLAAAERGEVAQQARRVAPAPATDRGDGPDTEAHVIAAEPVAEIVPGPQVAAELGAAEVRGLVPAIAGSGQRLDDSLEVVLHRLGLPLELVAVRVREARARLRLELIGGDVLRRERDRLCQVPLEVEDALARDPVDQVE